MDLYEQFELPSKILHIYTYSNHNINLLMFQAIDWECWKLRIVFILLALRSYWNTYSKPQVKGKIIHMQTILE